MTFAGAVAAVGVAAGAVPGIRRCGARVLARRGVHDFSAQPSRPSDHCYQRKRQFPTAQPHVIFQVDTAFQPVTLFSTKFNETTGVCCWLLFTTATRRHANSSIANEWPF